MRCARVRLAYNGPCYSIRYGSFDIYMSRVVQSQEPQMELMYMQTKGTDTADAPNSVNGNLDEQDIIELDEDVVSPSGNLDGPEEDVIEDA